MRFILFGWCVALLDRVVIFEGTDYEETRYTFLEATK